MHAFCVVYISVTIGIYCQNAIIIRSAQVQPTWTVGVFGALHSPPSDGSLLFVFVDEGGLLLKLHGQPEQHVIDLNHLVSGARRGWGMSGGCQVSVVTWR